MKPASQTEIEQAARTLLRRWRNDPVAYCKEALGFEPWSRQAEILQAIAKYDRVTVRSGHKVGKSRSAVAAALWFCQTRAGARVPMTSASFNQVKHVLWRELKMLHRTSKQPLGGHLHEDPQTGLVFKDANEIFGFSTRDAERAAGISGANMLYIVDEASGVHEPIFEAIEGNRAGGAKILMFSNPTQTSGSFYESHNAKRELWHTIHISSEESPNIGAGKRLIPGLAMIEWIEEKKLDWGEDSPIYQVRVKGEFPTQGTRNVIALALIDACRIRHQDLDIAPVDITGRLELGVDVARYGDDETSIASRRGKVAYPIETMRSMDSIQVAGAVVRTVKRMVRPGEIFGIPRVKIDVIGVGSGVYDQLKSRTDMDVVAINSSETANSPEEYVNRRTEMYFVLRDWMSSGAAIPEDSKLEGELAAPLYDFDGKARYRMESKDEIKARLKRSPDRADALALSVYNIAEQPSTRRYTSQSR